MGGEGLRKANAPTIKSLMKRGAWSLKARAVMPTSSSPNWASMIRGAGPEQHKIGSNDWATNQVETAPNALGRGGFFPTIFSQVREQRPEAVIACLYDWEGFGKLIEAPACHLLKHVKDAIETAQQACKYLESHEPSFLFIHFDGVDHAGHGFGWNSPQYFKAIELTDALVAAILKVVGKRGWLQNTAILITADHGGIGTSHGGSSRSELEIPWILSGPGIHRGRELKGIINTFDTAPTLARLLGVRPHPSWTGKEVAQAFTSTAR